MARETLFMKQLAINIERVKQHFSELALVNSGTKGYTRTAFSDEEMQAKIWLMEKLKKLGISFYMDGAKNVIARYGPQDKPSIAIGSHLDTVVEGGLFDGALGVIGGLEVLEVLAENKVEPSVPIELICFTGEEANPLGGTFGSRVMAGQVQRDDSYDLLLRKADIDCELLLDAARPKEAFLNYIELHIEQGEVLESNQKSIGIVTSIAGMIRFEVKIAGRASHSGTTPMHMRSDALVHAASLITEVNSIAKRKGDNIVATVGEISIFPNMANVVPGEARLLLEVRGSMLEKMREVKAEIVEWISNNIPNKDIRLLVEKYPREMDEGIQMEIEEASKKLGYSYRYMLSGANHDANAMSTLTDAGMIFVPSRYGISHHPDECTSWDDIEKGINTLLVTTCQLAEKKQGVHNV
ncbi:Zn-dependent hydrolase [Niallia circulans]|uniref:Zn-dependent hydrolase n=2 Tax=Niallia circulans TaxID=1397 RepID=A0A553SS42_NIACI|nr:Zn-dependent hydrolase [Niallia circulans]